MDELAVDESCEERHDGCEYWRETIITLVDNVLTLIVVCSINETSETASEALSHVLGRVIYDSDSDAI